MHFMNATDDGKIVVENGALSFWLTVSTQLGCLLLIIAKVSIQQSLKLFYRNFGNTRSVEKVFFQKLFIYSCISILFPSK